jgi:hypothetical protein
MGRRSLGYNLAPAVLDFFDVNAQIATNEANYADMNPGRNGEPLWQSDLYRPFAAGLANPPRIDLPSPR